MAEGLEGRCGRVRDWMSREPATVGEDCPVRQALGRMRAEGIRHLLVLDGDRLAGIVSDRDLGRLGLEDPGSPRLAEPVKRLMTEGPVTVDADACVTAAARVLLELKIGALPVREGDRVVGIFTTGDALEALLRIVEGPEP